MRATIEGLALVLALAVGDGDAEFSGKVDRMVARLVPPEEPGCAVLVLKEGETLHSKGYGLANVEHRLPIDAATTFDLASVGKQFTAYGLLVLEEEGKLSLRDDVRKYVPELPVYHKKRPIRISDLLFQVSGLPDYLGLAPYPKRDEEMTNADVAALVAKQKLDFPTGTKWAYSNSNYSLAALVLERATGKSYGEFMRASVFEPLGMTNTHVFDRPTKVIPHRAYGYVHDEKRLDWVHSDLSTTGDGGVWSCLDDFVKWDAELREPKLVSEERLDRALSSGKLDDGSETGYGLGWSAARDGDEPIAEHSGGWVGFLAHHLRYRDSGLTVVVLTNCGDGSINPGGLAHRIADAYRKETGGE